MIGSRLMPKFLQRLLDHFERPANFALDITKLRLQQRLLRIDDHIHARRNRAVQPDRLAQAPLHPVAHHCAAQHLPTVNPTRTPSAFGTWQIKHGHVRREMPAPLLVDALEIRVPKQT